MLKPSIQRLTDGQVIQFNSSEASSNQQKLEITWSNTPKTVYFLKDHLGSIRATVLDSATAPVIGYDDYDPWGYPLASRTKAIPTEYLQGASKNKFTGHEYDDDLGLNWVHTLWRPYIPEIARWAIPDPLAKKYPFLSPYVYVADNPIKFVDPNGKEIINNSKRTVSLIGDDYVGYNKTILRYKALGPNQRSNFVYDKEKNWTGQWDLTDYDFFNYEGVWYKAPSRSWLPLNYWITEEWGAKHPFNFLVRNATLEELGAIRDWLKAAGAPKEVIDEIERIIAKAEGKNPDENPEEGKKSKSDDEKQKQKSKDGDKDDDENDPHAGWGAENQGPPPRR